MLVVGEKTEVDFVRVARQSRRMRDWHTRYQIARTPEEAFTACEELRLWLEDLACNVCLDHEGEGSSRYGPSDLDDGEVALYSSAPGLEIRLTAEGDINAHSAAGMLIRLQGGDRGVARLNDNVACGTLIFTPSPPTLTYVPQGAPIPDPLPTGAEMIALHGVISSASDRTKTG